MVRFSQPPANLQKAFQLGNQIQVTDTKPLEILVNGEQTALRITENTQWGVSILDVLPLDEETTQFKHPENGQIMLGESGTSSQVIPSMTTTEMNNMSVAAVGTIVFNTTNNYICVKTASGWKKTTGLAP